MAASRNNPPADLRATVAEVLARHVAAGKGLCVALSGGMDSVALLHAARTIGAERGHRVGALHVNHRISPNAYRWEAFCAEMCERLGVALHVERINVAFPAGVGIEAAAREIRYRAFLRADADWLLTAHHRDDQALTVLHNLLRGTGVRGAAGIPVTRPLRPDPPLWLLRPLLEVPRADIEAYAREHGLSWIDDESNEDPRRGRTFLAREVIALLRARYPDCEAALSRAGRHFAQAESLLQVLGGEDLARCREPGSGIRIDRLAALGEQRAANALRVALACAGCRPPSNDRAREILRQFLHARPDAQPGVVVDGIVIRRFRGAIHLVRPVSGPPADPVAWRGEAAVAWGEARVVFEDAAGSGIRRSATGSGAWVLRTRQGGEYIRLADNRPRRTLKNAFQEEGVPPWERDVLPLLWRDGDLVWVAGVGVAADYRCPDGEPGITPRLVSGVRPALLHSEGG